MTDTTHYFVTEKNGESVLFHRPCGTSLVQDQGGIALQVLTNAAWLHSTTCKLHKKD